MFEDRVFTKQVFDEGSFATTSETRFFSCLALLFGVSSGVSLRGDGGVALVSGRVCLTAQRFAWRAARAGSTLQKGLFCGGFAESRGAFSCVSSPAFGLTLEAGLVYRVVRVRELTWGSLHAGLAIYDLVTQYIRPDVQTLCYGMAVSAGSLILGSPCRTPILIHQPSSGFQGQSSDIEIHAREVLELRRLTEEIYARHTGAAIEQVHEDMERDRFFGAQEAVDYGLGRPDHPRERA